MILHKPKKNSLKEVVIMDTNSSNINTNDFKRSNRSSQQDAEKKYRKKKKMQINELFATEKRLMQENKKLKLKMQAIEEEIQDFRNLISKNENSM